MLHGFGPDQPAAAGDQDFHAARLSRQRASLRSTNAISPEIPMEYLFLRHKSNPFTVPLREIENISIIYSNSKQ
jgi:hypothetical protein